MKPCPRAIKPMPSDVELKVTIVNTPTTTPHTNIANSRLCMSDTRKAKLDEDWGI